mgnify:CR=1 FL=1
MRGVKFLTILAIVFYVFLGNIALAEEQEKKHPIDVWLEKCIEKDSSTAGMINCGVKAYDMWDKELNKVYQELMKKLSPEERKLLRESQRQWLKFRDAEFKVIDKIYDFPGGFYTTQRIGSKIRIIRERALRLKEYLDEISEE